MSSAASNSEWADPLRVPLTYPAQFIAARQGTASPEGVQINLFTLVQIGGVYDLIALEVERQHLSILEPWRLDSGAPSAVDYIVARDRRRSQTRETSN